jgi:hypothetical protein
MPHETQNQTRLRSAALLVAAILAVLMFVAVMAYQFTGDFTGLFKSGTNQTIRMRD